MINEVAFGGDGDFSDQKLIDCANAKLSNELGNLESDFQSGTDGVDDLAGDIINPMEDAEYYQGSFGDDNLLPEYKSQGSDEEGEEAESKDVEV